MRKNFLSVNWKVIDGAARQKKMLRLRPNEDGQFVCGVENCMHTGFRSSRGLRRHIDTIHAWYYYFDKKPSVSRDDLVQDPEKIRAKCLTRNVPSFSVTEGIGADFYKWLQAPLGAGKNAREAKQIARRGMKFLLHVMGDDFISDSQAWADYIDCAIGSPSAVIRFMETITCEWKMSSSGALNYVKSICDLADFRKSQGVSDAVLRAFSVTEVYLRRGKDNLQKKKVMEYSRNLDLESLIIKDSWSSLEEMEEVIPFHAQRFTEVYQRCANASTEVSINDLAFASRFVATYLFLRVKCTRPRSFQYLTIPMIDKAKTNGGFVDQTEFKTAATYMFDTLILNDEVFRILDMYITAIRPKMGPKCDYLLISNTGRQYNSFTSAMTILVKQAIGKYVHPTRLRQIVETTSSERLTPEEQQAVTADQKHHSNVAQRCYKKKLSRQVAIKGRECMDKMLGGCRSNGSNKLSQMVQTAPRDINNELESILASSAISIDNIDGSVISATEEILGTSSPEEGELCNTVVNGLNSFTMECDVVTNTQAIPGVASTELSSLSPMCNISTTVKDKQASEKTCSDVVVTGTASGEGNAFLPRKEDDPGKLPLWPSTSYPTTEVIIPTTEVVVTGAVPGTSCQGIPVKEDDGNDSPTWPESTKPIVEVKEEEELSATRLRERKPTKKFSKAEDNYLIQGVQKYGRGHWVKILQDPLYKFDESRSRDTLRMRYGSAEVRRQVNKLNNVDKV